MSNQCAERDIMALDKQGGHYWRHANAMTAEGLHSKSDIAAELAYRDACIAELEAHVERLDNELQEKALTDDGVLADAYWNCADKITPWLGEKTGPDTLINSVAQSLEFLIEQWREKKIIEQERDAYRTAEEHQIALRQKLEGERDALAADRADLIKELIPLQNMTHGLARSGGCSPDYPNDAKAVLERVTGGHAPFFDDGSPSAKSLERRDLIQRALEIESLSLKMNKDWEGNDCLWPETLTDRYNELRKQAEAPQ
ncbi:hypothetical protein [Halomonas sp. MS1]|nr:hypothetical protein [Halomonas sp. MS1]UTD55907.1 hypothetical protein NF683_01425 [Halomonas sp. MS1]